MKEFGSLNVRPYQLMQIVARTGSGCKEDLGDDQLTELLQAVRKNSGLPITLQVPVDSNYRYQNPLEINEESENRLFAIRCDLKILQKMGMVPGATRPAIEMFHRLLKGVEKAEGIICFNEITSETWKGFGREECDYDKGRAMGLDAIIPPRNQKEKAVVKVDSAKAMYRKETLKIRPHHLMCMTCFYGTHEFSPIDEDNLFEAIDIIHKNPDIHIELVSGPCMICPPCSLYTRTLNQCISPHGMALRDELKDLDVLQILGLKYGDKVPARKLYTLLFEKVHSTTQICGYGDDVKRSPEWSVCPDGVPGYAKARAEGLGFL